MKRIVIVLFVLLASIPRLSAQEGLSVEGLFEGEIIPRTGMKQTFIRGASLQPYKLDVFKSISFTVDSQTFQTVEQLVLQDAEAARDKNMDMRGGHLTYAVLSLPQATNGSNRFLCFQAREERGKWLVTLVYLRGQAAIGDLNKMFNKRNP